jgi:phosphohistidine phosphatase SixA
VPKRNKVLVLVASCLGIYTIILFVLWNKSIVPVHQSNSSSSDSSSVSADFSSSHYESYASSSRRSHHSSSKSPYYYYSSNSLIPRLQQFLFDHFLPWGAFKDKTTSLQPPAHQTRSMLLVLHAEATPETPYIADPKRPLTAKGIRDAEELGVYLKENNIQPPDWIFASPSIRTSYTLELMRRHWASDVPVAFEDILYILAFNDYFAFCAGLNFNFHRVMIVGHNPAILNTAKKLMAHHGIEDFPEAGFMELRWTQQAEWMTLTPFTAETEMAVSPDELDKYFNLTVTKLSPRRREQQQMP